MTTPLRPTPLLAALLASAALLQPTTLTAQSAELFRFYPQRSAPVPGFPFATVLADLDGDGDLDAAVGGSNVGIRIFRNDGLGNLTIDLPASVITGDRAITLHAADLDGDGRLDLFGAGLSQVWRNDGQGGYEAIVGSTPPRTTFDASSIGLADLDGDGDLDVVVPGTNVRDQVFFNDGTGRFIDQGFRLPVDNLPTRAVAVGDVDADGDVDFVLASHRQLPPYVAEPKLYLNDGLGQFTAAQPSALAGTRLSASGAQFVDIDRDGDLDLLITQLLVFGQSGTPVVLLTNDGHGNFTDATSQLPIDPIGSVVALRPTDFDGDGDVDLVVAGQDRVRIWRNDGTAHFAEVSPTTLPQTPQRPDILYDCDVGDLDADGDPDLVITSSSVTIGLAQWTCQQRQIDASEQPQVGRRLELQIGNQPLGSAVFALAIPLLGTSRAQLPIAGAGVLGLDPTTLIQLPPVYLAPGASHTPVGLDVPPDPSLEGLEVFFQALIVETAGNARLTNVWPTRIDA